MLAITRRLGGLLAILLASLWLALWHHYLGEFLRAALYERVLHMLNPHIDAVSFDHLLQYGVPVLLVVLGLWLFWLTRNKASRHAAETPQISRPISISQPTHKTVNSRSSGRAAFDYSTYNGRMAIGRGSREFVIRFSRASIESIHLYKTFGLKRIARVKNSPRGSSFRFDDFDHTSDSYTINVGERFIAENQEGYFLQCLITGITYEGRNGENDEIQFRYRINNEKSPVFVAI